MPFCVGTATQDLSKHRFFLKFYSTGCMDPIGENGDVIIAVTQVCLEIYWHKLFARISNVLFRTTLRKPSRCEPSLSTKSTASLVKSCTFTLRTAYSFHQCHALLTNATTDNGTLLHWTKGDY